MNLGDINNPLTGRIFEGGYARPSDSRDVEGKEGGKPINIVELLPNFEVFHCRDVLTVVPGAGVLQSFVAGQWTLPWDGFVMSTRFELDCPNVVPLTYAFLRVGTTIPTISQATTITGAVNPFWTQMSGTKGSKVRILDPYQPYGKRVQKGSVVNANLQVVTPGIGANFDIEFDVQIKVLNLERAMSSAPG